MNKPWWQSVTIIGGIFFAALQSAETFGVVPVGASTETLKILSGFVTLFGLRRAVG